MADKPAMYERTDRPPAGLQTTSSRTGYLRIALILSLIILAGFGLQHLLTNHGPARGEKASRSHLAVPVTVAPVVRQAAPLEIRAIGTVTAISSIQIRSRVEGQLTHVYFKEGEFVRKGDPLFLIDPRPLQAALKQAQANLARDMAQVQQSQANLAKDRALLDQAEANVRRDAAQQHNAETQAGRYLSLVKQGAVSKEQFDTINTNAESLEATVEFDQAAVKNARAVLSADEASLETARATVLADRAALENAAVQLDYTSIHSPIDGRTGGLMVHEGNMVKVNDTTPLVVINQVSPIYVAFAIPQQELALLTNYNRSGTLRVKAVLGPEDKTPVEGILTFSDNTVDTATGTIKLKATFENQGRRLWPGQFVNVVLTLATEPNAILVPSQAVQTSQQGRFVYLLKPDLTVEQRLVEIDRSFDGYEVIKGGLSPGDTVVTDGQLQLVPGARVKVKGGLETTSRASP